MRWVALLAQQVAPPAFYSNRLSLSSAANILHSKELLVLSFSSWVSFSTNSPSHHGTRCLPAGLLSLGDMHPPDKPCKAVFHSS